ncbi:MAG: hypothetical protein OWT28_03095 [Firmicutes bacterium]|nr:hypothetical protein [Bacillota bacterium]
MSIFQFLLVMIVPAMISVYAWNFAIWLWRSGNRLGGVGGFLLTLVSGGGSLGYFVFKLLI